MIEARAREVGAPLLRHGRDWAVADVEAGRWSRRRHAAARPAPAGARRRAPDRQCRPRHDRGAAARRGRAGRERRSAAACARPRGRRGCSDCSAGRWSTSCRPGGRLAGRRPQPGRRQGSGREPVGLGAAARCTSSSACSRPRIWPVPGAAAADRRELVLRAGARRGARAATREASAAIAGRAARGASAAARSSMPRSRDRARGDGPLRHPDLRLALSRRPRAARPRLSRRRPLSVGRGGRRRCSLRTAGKPADSSASAAELGLPIRWCSPCRAAACRSGSRSRERSGHRSTSCWCARSARRAIPSWRPGPWSTATPPELVLNADVVRAYGINEAELAAERDRQLRRDRAPARALSCGPAARAAVRPYGDRGRRRHRHRRHRARRPAGGAPRRAARAGAGRAGCRSRPPASWQPVDQSSACTRPDLMAVGACYGDFRQVEDAEVVAALANTTDRPTLNTTLPADLPATVDAARASQQRLRGRWSWKAGLRIRRSGGR